MARQSRDRVLMAEVARLYYYEDLTQDQIGEVLGLSRQKVSRLLRQAKEEGLVQIRVLEDLGSTGALEERLRNKFGLRDARIATIFSQDKEVVTKRIAQVAASYLRSIVEPHTSLGVAYGKTLFAMVPFLIPKPTPGFQVVQIMGGYGKLKGEVVAIELARALAHNFGGSVVYLLAPAFAKDAETRNALLEDVRIAQVLELARRVDIALVGIGGVTSSSTLLDTGDIYPYEVAELVAKGAAGNICGNFYDAEGREVSCQADSRRISLTLQDLRKIPKVIGVAGGEGKFKAILGALLGGYINILITDDVTALALLREGEREYN
ncbi:sugar-binding transcriptional regulator [Candidatus Caldatribacterium sp.]|uniref:sugar-binding transcriptional regulator n=1 Tax=Candidatus Caldatribacterium sp. TaxID=2282143 RepID=UPI00299C5919|nr:sugar-binding transcriptional regulator [Candidatus Caldatribacterium sp.]MDW8081230.1 sugar-binding transcriptional regulator [Candidatus Calescibacterium sp.]